MARSLPVVDRPTPIQPAPKAPEAEGWTRRFVAAGDRLLEATRLYEELHFEVRLEPTGPADMREECGGCHLALEQFRIVYTRRPP